MIVAAYNPSTDPTNYTSIAVPHGHYSVYVFNSTSKAFQAANAAVLCDEEVVEKAVVNNCWLYVEYQIQGMQTGLISVQYNATADLTAPLMTNATGAVIENLYESLTYNGSDDLVGQKFLLSKKLYK